MMRIFGWCWAVMWIEDLILSCFDSRKLVIDPDHLQTSRNRFKILLHCFKTLNDEFSQLKWLDTNRFAFDFHVGFKV